jgi:CBS domain containing-hemolysin-like protein
MLGLLGHIPTEGQEVRFDHLLLKAEKVVGRRIKSVLITREPADEPSAADEHADEPVDKLDKA